MEALVRRPRLLPALLLLIVAGLVPVGITFERGILGQRARQQADSAAAAGLSEPERREYLERAERAGAYFIGAGALGGPVLAVLGASGLLYGLLLVQGGGRPSFHAVCAVVAHAWLPIALYSLLSVPILLVKDPGEIDLDNLIPLSNPAFLLPAEAHPKLHRVLASVDLFSLWVIGLLAVGWSRLAERPFRAGLAVVLAPWLLYVVVFKALLG